MAAAGGNHTTVAVPPDPNASSEVIMAGVKIRARVFAEAIMTMVCPVLLATARDSVKSKVEEHKFLLVVTAVIAGSTLLVGILQFLFICGSKIVSNKWSCGTSKCMIHLCVVLLMGLASVLLNLIGLKSVWGYVMALVIIAISSMLLCYMSWGEDHDITAVAFEEFNGSLDLSSNFSAAVTAVLFLGLEALALEGLMSDNAHEQKLPVGWSFGTCGIGVLSMLLVSVHPMTSNTTVMTSFLQGLSAGLGFCVCIVVYYFTAAVVGNKNAILLLTPACTPFFFWVNCAIQDCCRGTSSQETAMEELEPASMELTKIIFVAFLAVSVAANGTSVGSSTVAFLCFSGAAIVTGLQWRLMTHRKKVPHALARAADAAFVISHMCMACAAIPFAVLAARAVKLLGEVAN